MEFKQLDRESEERFRRLTGVQRSTFNAMVNILTQAETELKVCGGRPHKVLIEDRLLMTLEYWREYRTYFHISRSYNLSESSCYRNIRWIEDILIKDGQFSLPGRKALVKSDVIYNLVLVDATETPIERPKKNKSTFTQARKRDTP